jgi:ketosteroid isomerase-like protein
MDANATAGPHDLEALLALNRDYIGAVQNGDVRRFGEILADDFLCSNPDGSLVGREAFLRQTARPVTIRDLGAEDVRVRVLGDVAIVHARTGYTTAGASGATAATPTSGRAAVGSGSRYRHTSGGNGGQPFFSHPRAPCCQ